MVHFSRSTSWDCLVPGFGWDSVPSVRMGRSLVYFSGSWFSLPVLYVTAMRVLFGPWLVCNVAGLYSRLLGMWSWASVYPLSLFHPGS